MIMLYQQTFEKSVLEVQTIPYWPIIRGMEIQLSLGIHLHGTNVLAIQGKEILT